MVTKVLETTKRRAGDSEVVAADSPDHTLRIQGEHAPSGTIAGRVEANKGSYTVLLEHELWKNKLGELPNMVVKSGETFEFTNVPVGECTVTANPVLVINDVTRERRYLSTTVEVKDGQTATADLIDSSESNKRLIGQWVGGGGFMPVHHTFSADGSYERRIDNDPPERMANGD